MEAAALMRSVSCPLRPPLAAHHDASGISFSLRRSGSSSGFFLSPPRPLHLDHKEGRRRGSGSIRRVRSEASLAGSDGRVSSHAPPTGIAEEADRIVLGVGVCSGTGSATVVPEEEEEEVVVVVEFDGGGEGRGRKSGGGQGGGGGGDRSGMGVYYQEMLKADPGNPLLLRNYGKFLHEVEGDVEGAEECYGRAILESPGDGEVLSLYGNLIWEAHRDEGRAGNYFERAVEASPDDCYVLGSYAHFLWDAEEEEEEQEKPKSSSSTLQQHHQQPKPLVKAH